MDLTFQPNRTQEVETAKAHSVPNVTTTSHDPGMPARPNFASHPNPVIPQGLCPTRSGSLYPHIAHLGTNLVGLGDSNNEIVIIVMMYQFISLFQMRTRLLRTKWPSCFNIKAIFELLTTSAPGDATIWHPGICSLP